MMLKLDCLLLGVQAVFLANVSLPTYGRDQEQERKELNRLSRKKEEFAFCF